MRLSVQDGRLLCVCVSIASPSLSLLTGEDMVSKGSGVYVAAVSD